MVGGKLASEALRGCSGKGGAALGVGRVKLGKEERKEEGEICWKGEVLLASIAEEEDEEEDCWSPGGAPPFGGLALGWSSSLSENSKSTAPVALMPLAEKPGNSLEAEMFLPLLGHSSP